LKRPYIILIAILLIQARQFTYGQQKDTINTRFRFSTIVIDPGHGGKDPGAHGSYSLEKNVALAIGKKLKAALTDSIPDVNVIMTRTDDTFIELNKRSAIANENHANLFISIHCNSSPEGVAYRTHKQIGALVLVYGYHRKEEQEEAIRENASIYKENDYKQNYAQYDQNDPVNAIMLNAFMEKYRKQSILFASLLINEFKDDNRQIIGIKEQGVLVLAHSAMPAVLVETGFINNPDEETYLNSDTGQDEIVQSIIRAIQNYRDDINVKQ
jgi:N-acetylmuramoyl-L-alanine amidase